MDLCELGRIAVKAREVLDGVQFGIFATIFGNLEADPNSNSIKSMLFDHSIIDNW